METGRFFLDRMMDNVKEHNSFVKQRCGMCYSNHFNATFFSHVKNVFAWFCFMFYFEGLCAMGMKLFIGCTVKVNVN